MAINLFDDVSRLEVGPLVSGLALSGDGHHLALTFARGEPHGVVVYNLTAGSDELCFGHNDRHGESIVFGGVADGLFCVITTSSLVDEIWRVDVGSSETERLLAEEDRHIHQR